MMLRLLSNIDSNPLLKIIIIFYNMKKEKKIVVIDTIIMVIFYAIFSPFVLLYVVSLAVNVAMKYLFDKLLNPLCNKICILVRNPIPNSTVQVKGSDGTYFKRVNEKLLTIKEAKKLGKQYEDEGYEVHLYLSEF